MTFSLQSVVNVFGLTVAAERAAVGGHGAVTGEALPQLQTHSLVMAGVLRAGRAGTCMAHNGGTKAEFLFSKKWKKKPIVENRENTPLLIKFNSIWLSFV